MTRTTRLMLLALEPREVPANFAVTTTADSNAGSLRFAIAAANSNPGPDTIVFEANTFSTPKIITLTSGDIDVSDELTIIGPGRNLLTINGNANSRIFDVIQDGLKVNAFRDFTLTNGRASTEGGGAIRFQHSQDGVVLNLTRVSIFSSSAKQGGAIAVGDTVQFTGQDLLLRYNSAVGGGAVSNSGGVVTISHSEISDNSASNSGGGLSSVLGRTLLTDTGFERNSADISGGGIMFDFSDDIIIDRCLFSSNHATTGGGVHFENGEDADLNREVRNSTFANNSAVFGGALNVSGITNTRPFRIEGCTIVGNTASSEAGGISLHNGNPGTIVLGSSIVVDNLAPESPNIHSEAIHDRFDVTNNAYGDRSGGSFTGPDTASLLNVTAASLKLGALALNGYELATMALADDSPARNIGLDFGNTTDQRGEPRVTNGSADIGAYETRPIFVVTNTKDAGVGSFRQAVLDANAFTASSQELITFDPAVFNVPRQITLTSGGIVSTGSIEVDGPGANMLIISGNNAMNGLQFGSGSNVVRDVTVANVMNTPAIELVGGVFRLDSSVIRNNSGLLSALRATSTDVTVNDSAIRNNSTNGTGGGIETRGTSRLELENSTVANNTAVSGGGVAAAGAFSILNTTISGNTASDDAGGVILSGLLQSVFISNSTITRNTATVQGGGLHVGGSPNQSIFINDSVIAENTAASAKDIFTFHVTTPVNVGTSAIGTLTGIAKFIDQGGNIPVATNLKLNALAANGGLGMTHLPRPGSPLLDRAANGLGLITDQRGQPRTVNGKADIGAVEAHIAPQYTVSVNGGEQRSRVETLTVDFDRVVTLGPLAFEVIRQGPSDPSGPVQFIPNVVNSPTNTSVTLTFSPSAFTEFHSLIDGNYFLALFQEDITDNQGLNVDGNGDGIGGDTGIFMFHRLFGDANGDRTVDGPKDFAEFGIDFGRTLVDSPFDFNDDGTIDGAFDFAEFGKRFGKTL